MTASPGTEEFAANLALGHLGQPEIAAMSDPTTRARKIRQFFPVARDELQRDGQWNFATAWIAPAMDPVAGIGFLKNRFALPADCLRVRLVKDCVSHEWAVESAQAAVGGVPVETMILVTNQTAPIVCINRRVTSVRLWDAMFLPAFAYLLASYCARSFGKSKEWGDAMRAQALLAKGDAAAIDGKEGGPRREIPETSWSQARRGPRRGGRFLR